MSWYKNKIKILPADTKFSRHIRERDGWKCMYKFICLGAEDFSENKGQLDCSHFIKRGNFAVRYNEDNCDAACKKCHHFVENDPEGQKVLEEWKKAQLGEKRFNKLLIEGASNGHRDHKLHLLTVNAMIEEAKKDKKKRQLGIK